MARPVYQYKPNNDTPDIAIGILLPLNKGAAGQSVKGGPTAYSGAPANGLGVFESSYTTQEAVISNLKNLLLTSKGERYMQPNFGTDIKSILFENNTRDIRNILESTIQEDIEYWLPYVNLTNTKVQPSADMHSLNVQLSFFISTIGANIVINILASENEFSVTEVDDEDVVLTEVSSFGADTAFSLGGGGTY
tara:strand:- start:111 stop:689 length:579 start_codon:yes stop_codon:yes gene_type:complete